MPRRRTPPVVKKKVKQNPKSPVYKIIFLILHIPHPTPHTPVFFDLVEEHRQPAPPKNINPIKTQSQP